MARPKKNEPLDLTKAHDITAGVIERLFCPVEKPQVFLRDSESPSLRVRCTPPNKKNPDGIKAFVFEAKLNGDNIRMTIGDVRSWSIKDARGEANKLRVLVDQGTDPRQLAREKETQAAARLAEEATRAVTLGEAWSEYLRERGANWGEASKAANTAAVHLGGEPRKRWKGKLTVAGTLAPLVPIRLADIDSDLVYELAEGEKERPPQEQRMTRARNDLDLLGIFFRWCMVDKRYKGLVKEDPTANKRLRELMGSNGKRKDVLQREQLAAWFAQVRLVLNPIISVYLQCVLLTGVRRSELETLRWANVDMTWDSMTVKDKIHPSREVPLTPYVKHLLNSLPRANEWVFPSVRPLSMDEKHIRRRERYNELQGKSAPVGTVAIRSASGHIEDPADAHTAACKAAGISLTLHGLRRSFATLSEWTDLPAGVAAQIQGHAPQGVREQHYIHRPLDILRMHHTRFEAWVLEEAGIEFKAPPSARQVRLAAVDGKAA